jgi:hypothetical protein
MNRETKLRLRGIIYWITTGIVALETGVGAEWDLFRTAQAKNVIDHLGYPDYLLTILGIWKIPAFIVILAPKLPLLKEWAYAGLFFVYSGAVASHMLAGDGFAGWVGPFMFLLLTVASWALRPDSRKWIDEKTK